MPLVTHFYSEREEGKSLVVFIPGAAEPWVAVGSHPNFDAIKAACEAGDLDEVLRLKDIVADVVSRFTRLGDRVTTRDRRIYFDGDEVHNSLTDKILDFYEAEEDFAPLVNFFERVAFNPSSNSRDQLYDWIALKGLTLLPDGRFVAYKGVSGDSTSGYRSGFRGHGFVNDVEFLNDYLPYAVGDDVRMPRAEVEDRPEQACAPGLHAGTYTYAEAYASRGVMLRVTIDPADVVSVPRDGAGEKIRVCRFVIEEIINEPVEQLVLRPEENPVPELSEDIFADAERHPQTGEYITVENIEVGQHVTTMDPDTDQWGYYRVTSRPTADDSTVTAIFVDRDGHEDADELDSSDLDGRTFRLHHNSPVGLRVAGREPRGISPFDCTPERLCDNCRAQGREDEPPTPPADDLEVPHDPCFRCGACPGCGDTCYCDDEPDEPVEERCLECEEYVSDCTCCANCGDSGCDGECDAEDICTACGCHMAWCECGLDGEEEPCDCYSCRRDRGENV
jgi:hypothetical protein